MSGLSRELALRIGLAAREIPGVTVSDMMNVLVTAIGVPFTSAKLESLNVTVLRAAAGGLFSHASRHDLRVAIALLTGRRPVEINGPPPPSPQPSATKTPGLRVAVASNYGEAMNGSFSTCTRFLIYRLNPADLSLIDVRNPADAGRKNERDRQRAELLTDCHLLCACALGNLASARLMGTGIHPLLLACNDNARDALRPIQDVLASAPPPWMARAMGREPTLSGKSGYSRLLLAHSS